MVERAETDESTISLRASLTPVLSRRPATGATRGDVRGFWGRGGGFGRGSGITLRGPAVGLTAGGAGARRLTLIAG